MLNLNVFNQNNLSLFIHQIFTNSLYRIILIIIIDSNKDLKKIK